VTDSEEMAVATAQVTLQPHVVFPALVDLDTAPSWSSIEIARLAVPAVDPDALNFGSSSSGTSMTAQL
jgi:hypothetical protein